MDAILYCTGGIHFYCDTKDFITGCPVKRVHIKVAVRCFICSYIGKQRSAFWWAVDTGNCVTSS